MQPTSSLYEILKICVGMHANRRIAGGAPIHYVTQIIFSGYFRGFDKIRANDVMVFHVQFNQFSVILF